MSLAMACWWTLARTVILCLVAWPVIVLIERWLRGLPENGRLIALATLLAPFLFPELLVGYTYRKIALAAPQQAELLCAGLLFVRIVPVGVVALLASPESLIDAGGLYCRWLLVRENRRDLRQWQRLAECIWQGPIRRTLPAIGLMGLVAFQEFELAALLMTASWTDWFITMQRTGLDQRQMLSLSLWPTVMQLPLLIGNVIWLTRQEVAQTESDRTVPPVVPRAIGIAVIAYLVFALAIGCLFPLGGLAWHLPSGLGMLLRQSTQLFGLGREILIAMGISVCAGFAAWYGASLWTHRRSPARVLELIATAWLLPGLIGSLLLSLFAVSVFQQSFLRPLYDSPLPWLFTLFVWLLPRAVLLQLWLGAMTRSEGVYLAELLTPEESLHASDRTSPIQELTKTDQLARRQPNLRAAGVLFRLRDQPRLLGIGLLCYWAYLDLSTAYLLAPTGMPSGLVRLYNFMHFGRFTSLSAESFLFFGTPVLFMFLLIQAIRFCKRI